MNIRTIVVCLPARDLEKSLEFYKNALGCSDIQIDEGIIALELPNLSLFLMEVVAFETYTKRAGRRAQFPGDKAGAVISCAMETKDAVDSTLAKVPIFGGAVPIEAAVDEISGGYTGYFSDPDGHIWELVFPQQQGPDLQAT